MPAQDVICFKLLDGYSRAHHACFLAEMFPSGTDYWLCFRPTGVNKESPNRYACRYLKIGLEEMSTAALSGALPISIAETLDKELSTLPKS